MIIIVAIILYTHCTPTGALRLAILGTGHPISALVPMISDNTYKGDIKENQILYTIENAPIEKATQASLKNWVITRYGFIYIGKHYGY